MRFILLLLAALLSQGCITKGIALRSYEFQLEAKGFDREAVNEIGGRNPSAAALWSLLPGGGSIYNGESAGTVIPSILSYPLLGPIWHPLVEYRDAENLNIFDAAIRERIIGNPYDPVARR